MSLPLGEASSVAKTHKQMNALMHTDGTSARSHIDLLVVALLVSFVHLFTLMVLRHIQHNPRQSDGHFPCVCQRGLETKEPLCKSQHSLNDRKPVLITLLLKKHSKPVKTHIC